MTTEIQSFLPPYASNFSGRQDQFLPVLSEAEISRIERFGEHRKYRRGERLFAAGERAPGIFAVLKGGRKSAQWTWSRSACRAPRSGNSLARSLNSPAALR